MFAVGLLESDGALARSDNVVVQLPTARRAVCYTVSINDFCTLLNTTIPIASSTTMKPKL